MPSTWRTGARCGGKWDAARGGKQTYRGAHAGVAKHRGWRVFCFNDSCMRLEEQETATLGFTCRGEPVHDNSGPGDARNTGRFYTKTAHAGASLMSCGLFLMTVRGPSRRGQRICGYRRESLPLHVSMLQAAAGHGGLLLSPCNTELDESEMCKRRYSYNAGSLSLRLEG